MAPPVKAPETPAEPWGEFLAEFGADWRQGEHVALVGPTGQGKTTVALELLPLRKWSVVIATKPKDRTLAGLVRQGYRKVATWSEKPTNAHRVLLWPRWRGRHDHARQAAAIKGCIDAIYRAGSWCIFIDDLQYVMQELGLRQDVTTLWLMARSLNITVMGSTQRPRNAPVEMWNQSTHLFIWGTHDADDLRRLGGLGGLDSKRIREDVAGLAPHDVLYVNTRSGRIVRTNLRKK